MPEVGRPEQGYYWRRYVRGGPKCAVRIWFGPPHDPIDGSIMDRSPRWQATVNGQEADPLDTWTSCCGHPIDEAEYNYMMGLSKWAKEHAPDAPEANPRTAISLGTMKPLF